ncbi:hypothetical protein [Mucilaginibacter sp.]|uniref:YXWGXW repeat-containing protein n=1 Tax=Mucilaginibacter sp. TaxID=1882438 RepID=UPI002849FCB9|nr:hypothetical protein [Mucilaginibacter sp.]MDR3693737.1 hypothetical protein [Mucilaginibacter sp.]
MKSFFPALFMFAFCSISYAQNPVVDIHPRSQIYVIDLQSGQETPVNTDAAILFKNALIDLVRTTYRARMVISNVSPEYNNRVFTITQMGVETNVNGYQIVLDHWAQDPAQNVNIYTFVYHVDDNTLYFYDPANQSWLLERIMPNNVFNLRRVATYAAKFNEELANQQPSDQNGQVGADASVDLNQPVDADVATDTPPPAMPEYEQPECPSDGYLWQPGYWAFSQERGDYYWVPGAWVAPPTTGVLWTPPYWGYEGDRYIFHIGYWGDHIGFYGGINYGYGYGGHGYDGGEWRGGHFNYNRAVVRVNTNVVHNTYVNTTVINNVTVNNRSSFNGGRGGVTARPTSAEIVATHERHLNPTPAQNGNQLAARVNPQQFAKGNQGGKPANLASPKVIIFHPQNNNFNKGGNPGIGGKPGQPQGNNPGRPTGQPGIPNGQGNNPARPTGQPANPNGQGNNPGRPAGQPGNPNGQGNNPGRPAGQPGNPNGQGNNPGKPAGLPANPPRPVNQPVNPPKPVIQQAKPAKPAENKPKQQDKPVKQNN